MNHVTTQPDDATPVVLLVDDCVDVHRLLEARLRSESIELVGARDGSEGLRLARSIEPAIILLDLDMPTMDGFEVLRELKDDPKTVDIPVIVLSGLQSPHDKVTAFDLGAVDYVTKPFELTELRVRVRSALRLHMLVQMLAQRAQLDGLTGLWNRTYFDSRWAEETQRAGRHTRPLSLALLDLDHFKSINDTFGHPAGDAVIQRAAKLLQREARQSDICCRYGGEEFAIIMTDTDSEDARNLCERIRHGIEQIRWPRHPERTVTMSIGIAGSDGPNALPAEQWLEVADRNLYASKAAGRNRVTCSDVGGRQPRLAEAG